MNTSIYKEALLQKQAELTGGDSGKPLQWSIESNSGRQGDMAGPGKRDERGAHPFQAEAD